MDSLAVPRATPCRGCCLHENPSEDYLRGCAVSMKHQQTIGIWNENTPPRSPLETENAQRNFTLFREMPAASSLMERTPLSSVSGSTNTIPPSAVLAARRLRHRIRFTHCVFCKNNGENEDFYMSHTVKDDFDRVICPVLSAYRCPVCDATGMSAHTLKYCPKNKERIFYERLVPFLQHRRSLAYESRPILRAPGGPVYADGGYGTGSVSGESPPETPFNPQEIEPKYQLVDQSFVFPSHSPAGYAEDSLMPLAGGRI